MRPLILKKNEDRRLRAGHLWVFSNEIDVRQTPLTDFEPGEPAQIRDSAGRPLGTAYVNPASLIAARLVSHDADEPLDGTLLRHRLRRALALRERLFAEPWYRLCHGEGDWLPGLVIDRFGPHLAVQISTAGMERQRDVLLELLHELFQPESVLLRNDMAVRELEGLPRLVEVGHGTPPETVSIRENGVTFEAPFAGGQKTGWFYDQRPNRLAAASLARDSRVLDAFAYVGAFGVLAARHGARSVTFLDASQPALDMAQRNLDHADAPHCAGEVLQGDALEQLASLRQEGRRFDMVCLDPPAFIKRRKDAEQGLTAYRRVNDLGLQVTEDGGILVSSSCSHHLEAETLRRLVSQCCARRGFFAQLLYQGGQGPDHPVHPAMPETAYLKCSIFRVWKK